MKACPTRLTSLGFGFVICLCLGLAGKPAVAGIPPLDWSAATASNVYWSNGTVDRDGNVIAVGWITVAAQNDWIVRKYDSHGATLWEDIYAGPSNSDDAVLGVTTDEAGNVIAGGRTYVTGQDYNWMLRKYGPNGAVLWTKTYNSPASGLDQIWGVSTDTNGDVIAGGSEYRADLGEGHNWLVTKYRGTDGTLLWSRTYSHPPDTSDGDQCYHVATDAVRNVYAVGLEHIAGPANYWRIIKYDTSGNVVWSRSNPCRAGNTDGRAQRVAVDPSGNIVVAGTDIVNAWPDYDWLVCKYDPSGNLLWQKSYNGPGSKADYCRGLAFLSDGTVLVAGFQTAPGTGRDWILRAYDPAGTVLWTFTLGGALDDEMNGLGLDTCDGIYLLGKYGSGSRVDRYTAVPNCLAPPVISVAKSVTPANPQPGQALTYTIRVTNAGTVTVTALTVTDTLPALVAMTGQTSVPPLAWNASTSLPAWTGALALEPGQTATVTISGIAASCITATVFNTAYARASSSGGSDQRSAMASFFLVSPAPAAALSVSATHSPSVPGNLSPVTFTLVVTNAGAATITSLTIVDSLPTGVVMTGESNTGGLAWNGNSAVPAWSGPVVLSPGQGITVTVNAATTCAGGVMSHRGWAYATAACATAQAASPADAFSLPNGTVLVATLTVSPSSPTSGAAVRYTLVVTNAGAATVTSLTITDSVPAAVVFTGQGNSAGLTWNGSPTVPAWTGAVTLLPGQSITVTVDAVASSTHSGVVTNTGWVLGTGGCGSVQASAAASFTLQPPDELGRDGVKIVGGIRGYIQPKRGEQATILVRPATAGPITVRIYNLRGELVRQLDANATGGRTEVLHWNATDSAGNDVPPGAYPIVIEGPGIRVRDTLAVLR